MAEYWLKASADVAAAEGPLSAAEVKRRAAHGEIARETLISMDNAEFYPAGRVKGLFPKSTTAAPVATATATATAPAPAKPVMRGGLPPSYPGAVRTVIRSIPVTAPAVAPPPPSTDPVAPIAPPPPPIAENGDGAIESQPAIPVPTLAPPPLPAPPAAPVRPAFPTHPGTATPHLVARKTRGFLVVAIVMLFAGLLHAYVWYLNFVTRGFRPDLELLRIVVCLIWIPPAIVALILWLKWLSAAHKDIAVLTGYAYGVGPAKATAYSVIPLFNIFWAVSAPTRLAGAVNQALESAGQPRIARGAVTMCQLISILAPFVGLYAITPLMYAMSMRIIQGGLNRLAALQYAR